MNMKCNINQTVSVVMNRPLLLIACCCLSCFAIPGTIAAASSPPNIVIILADDLGYGDVSCYGATKIKTPNIDRLAREGMKFSDAHTAASVCSPSRYGLMTGRSPWRLHRKGNSYTLEPGRMTLASLLKVTAIVPPPSANGTSATARTGTSCPSPGRWRWGSITILACRKTTMMTPAASSRITTSSDASRARPSAIVKGKEFPEGLAEPRVDDQVGITLTRKALGFIRDNAQRPFFLYFTPCVPHTHIAPAAEFRGTSQAGLLGDYIQELDAHVGMILSMLDELKLTDNTLIIFTSDNGGTPKDFKGTQGTKLNLASEAGGIREKFMTAKADAKAMGHVTNGKWHDGKGSPYEGGHRVPFIARWPGRIAPATSSDYTFCLTDMLATAAEVLEVKLPDNAGEDSISLLPVLLGKQPAIPVRKAILVQGDTDDNAIAICSGQWKAIESTNAKNEKVHRLYDLTKDPGETTDVAKEHPEVVRQLAASLEKARSDGRTRK